MAKEPLDEREFELVNIIGARLGLNQRDLSRQMDMSLGMVNMLIRRLIAKGYIRIHQLSKRKVEYLLTPAGFAEKMRKSVKYTLKTINSIGVIKSTLKDALLPLVKRGEKNFIIVGESDFAVLVELVIKELCSDGYTIDHVQKIPDKKTRGVLLICREEKIQETNPNSAGSINLVEELAREYYAQKQNEVMSV